MRLSLGLSHILQYILGKLSCHFLTSGEGTGVPRLEGGLRMRQLSP